jgi:hypothetical protein
MRLLEFFTRTRSFSAPVGNRERVAAATLRFLYNEPFRKRRLMYMVYPRSRSPQVRRSQQTLLLDVSSLGTLTLQTTR